LPVITFASWEGADAAVATLTSALRKADAMGETLESHIIVLNDLRHSLSDQTDMMIAAESLYLAAGVPKSEVALVAAQIQQGLPGETPRISDQLSQLLLRFFQWRRAHTRRKDDNARSAAPTAAGERCSPGDDADRAEEVADEPFEDPNAPDHKPV
jgi:hypothetical protein